MKKLFNQRVKINIPKIKAEQRDVYTTGCPQDYNYFKYYYKMIGIDLSKQKALDDDSKAIQYISFIGNLEQQAK